MTLKKFAVLACAAAALVAGGVVFWFRAPHAKGTPLAGREQAMELLGARIAELCPNCKVLVLGNPYSKKAGLLSESSQYERTALRGLRSGLGSHSVVEVDFPQLRPEFLANPQSVFVAADSRTPLCYVIQPESVDQLAAGHPDCRVIVSLIGLPVGTDKLKIWEEKDSHCFALLLPDLRPLGPPAEVAAAFERGKLLACVVEDGTTGTPLVVTRQNVGEVMQKQPHVFGY